MKTKKCSLSIIILIALSLILTTSPCRAYFGENSSQAPSGHSMAAIIAGSAIAGIAGLALAFGNFFGKNNPSKDAVTYDPNGASSGKAPVDTSTYDDGATPKVLDNSGNLEKDRSQLLGWSDTPNATVAQYTAGQTIDSLSGSKALYAVYGASITYKNTVSDTTGAPPIDNNKYTAGSPVTVLGSGALVKNNYYFQGWSETDTQKPVTYYKEGGIITMPAKGLTLYAVWSQKPYSVTYDANGAEGSVPAGIVYYNINEKAIVLGNIATPSLSKAGFHFSGWSTTASATAAQYQPDASISMQSSVTLYAIWTCNVLYNATGNNTIGTVPIDSNNYTNGSLALIANQGNLTNQGYYFNNWSNNSSSSIGNYISGTNTTMTGDLNLFAQWIQKPYYVAYHSNGATSGNVPVGKIYYDINDVVIARDNNATMPLANTGFNFSGWSIDPNASVPQYVAGGPISLAYGSVDLYAVWLCNIKYSTNGGNGTTPTDTNNYIRNSTTVLKDASDLTMSNHHIVGWTGNNNSYNLSQSIIMNGSLYLTAKWAINPYSITYNDNGSVNHTSGTLPSDGKHYNTDDNATILNSALPLVDTTPSGYVFMGWSTEPPMPTQVQYSYNGSYNGSSNITFGYNNISLNAVWGGNLTYNANGGIGSVPIDNNTYVIGTNTTVQPQGNLTRSNNYFHGWSTSANASNGTTYLPGNPIQINNTTTLYAVWDTNPWSVIYNGNMGNDTYTYGASPIDPQHYSTNGTATVLNNTGNGSSYPLTCAGYNFSGWSTTNNSTTAQYQPGSNITLGNNNTTLYAVWKRNQITYKGNGNTSFTGFPPNDIKVYTNGSTVTLLNNTFIKDNFAFQGWDFNNSVTNATYHPNGTASFIYDNYYNGTGYYDLYAIWGYSITYNGGNAIDGAAPSDLRVYTPNATAIIKDQGNLTYPSYNFNHWEGDDSTLYNSSQSVNMTKSLNLTANWTRKPYKVTYDANNLTGRVSGNAPVDPVYYNGATDMIIFGNNASVPMINPGFTFSGWSIDPSASSPQYRTNSTAQLSDNLTLYAVWLSNITYGANGGIGTPPVNNANYTYDSIATLDNGTSLTKPDYHIIGWTNDSTGSYNLGQNITMNGSLYLTANWARNPYRITYNNSSSQTNGIAPRDYKYYNTRDNATILDSAYPFVRPGYIFMGWSAQNQTISPMQVQYSSTSSYNGSNNATFDYGDIKLNAVWGGRLTYNASGATGSVPQDNDTYPIGSNAVAKGNSGNLTKDPLYFRGWSKSPNPDFKDLNFLPGEPVPINESVTIYAVWDPSSLSVEYNGSANDYGIAPLDKNSYQADDNATVLNNTGRGFDGGPLIKTDYHFNGWNTLPNGTGDSYQPGSNITLGRNNSTLYAIWSPNQIRYDGNGYTDFLVMQPNDPTVFDANNTSTNVILQSNTFINNYRTFQGWDENKNATDAFYKPNGTFNITYSIYHAGERGAGTYDFYAIWGAMVTYDPNGASSGTPPIDPNIYGINASVAVLPNSGNLIGPGGVPFMGWATNADGTGELNSTFNITKNTTLYANWIGGSYGGGEVIYIGNGTNDITDPRKILIMAKADQSDGMMWAARNGQVDYTKTSAYFGLISNDSSGTIGSGGNNTNIITTLLPNDVSAAKVCHDYRNPGEGTVQYTDWYLPSQWELNAMYMYAKNGTTSGCNVSNGSRGGFKCSTYWSSTELNDHDGINVWSQSFFLDSGQFYYSKTYNIPRVRAVRAVPY